MQGTFVVYGRAYKIVAEFTQGEAGMLEANKLMEQHRGTGLLHEGGGRLIIASLDDKGTPITKASS